MLLILHVLSRLHNSWYHINASNHSCIVVTEMSESEPVGPTEVANPEPGVEYVVEPEENQGKQLSMIPCTHLN